MGTDVVIAVMLDLEKETKGALRYAERVADGEEPRIGTLYIRRTAFETPGSASTQDCPQAIKVTVGLAEPAP